MSRFGRDAAGFAGPGAGALADAAGRLQRQRHKNKKRKAPGEPDSDDDSSSQKPQQQPAWQGVMTHGDPNDKKGGGGRLPNVPRPKMWMPDRSRRLPEGLGSFMGTFLGTANYVTIDRQQLEACAKAYDTDPLVKIATGVMRNSILGGGIDIVRPVLSLSLSLSLLRILCVSLCV